MKLPSLTRKKHNDPLSLLQAETVGLVSAYHQGKLSDDELTVAIGEELEKSRQSLRQGIRQAIEQCRSLVIENSKSTDSTFKRGIDLGADLMENHLLVELELDDAREGRKGKNE